MDKRTKSSAIASFVFTSINIALMAFGVGTVLGFSISWPWLILGGFVAFGISVFMLVKSKNEEISEMQALKPSISVAPVEQQGLHRLYKLQVKNTGAKDTFKAQIKVEASQHDTPAIVGHEYIGFWEHANSEKAEIVNGLHDNIEIATMISSRPPYLGEHLELYHYNPQAAQRECFFSSSTYYVGSYVTDSKGKHVRNCEKPEFIIGVTIGSDKTTGKDLFYKRYKLTLDGIEEVFREKGTIPVIGRP